MTKLWQKGYSVNEKVERFEAAQNSILDMRLICHDVWGSLAHAAMLKHIGLLTEEEHQELHSTLCSILAWRQQANLQSCLPMKTFIQVSKTSWYQQQA